MTDTKQLSAKAKRFLSHLDECWPEVTGFKFDPDNEKEEVHPFVKFNSEKLRLIWSLARNKCSHKRAVELIIEGHENLMKSREMWDPKVGWKDKSWENVTANDIVCAYNIWKQEKGFGDNDWNDNERPQGRQSKPKKDQTRADLNAVSAAASSAGKKNEDASGKASTAWGNARFTGGSSGKALTSYKQMVGVNAPRSSTSALYLSVRRSEVPTTSDGGQRSRVFGRNSANQQTDRIYSVGASLRTFPFDDLHPLQNSFSPNPYSQSLRYHEIDRSSGDRGSR